jgi:hypothetical protein
MSVAEGGGLSPNALYNVSGFSLSPIKTDRHHMHVTETIVEYGFVCSFIIFAIFNIFPVTHI